MAQIYKYTDYRLYLRDFYLEQKSRNENFSFQTMANKAGFRSKSFIKLVIDGKKNLTRNSVHKLNSVLKLNEKAFSYFEDLVSFNQAKTLKMRNYFFEKLSSYNKRSPGRLVLQNEFEFYSNWYHNTIREIVTAIPFKDDYRWLSRTIHPNISPKQAKESVKLLLNLNLIQKKSGGYEMTDKILTTGNEVKGLAVSKFHVQNLELAARSIDSTPSGQRDVSCLVLGLSEKSFLKLKGEIQSFRKKILDIAEHEKKVEKVYHVNFQLFPTTGKIKDEEKKEMP